MSRRLKRLQKRLVEKVKKGRSTYGAIYRHPDGKTLVYLAHRRRRDIFRCGEATISDAVRKGTAEWAIDEETLSMLRTKKVDYIGIVERDSDDIYLTKTDWFFDRDKAKSKDYSRRGGAAQRYMPFHFFRKSFGKVTVR